MTGRSPRPRVLPLARVSAAALACMLVAARTRAAEPPVALALAQDEPLAAINVAEEAGAFPESNADIHAVRPAYGPPGEIEGIPSDAKLEADGAIVGAVFIDNQNIFDPNDPKDNTKLFRLADRLHIKTRARVVRAQLLFKPGDKYSRRLLDESERILACRQLLLRRLDPRGALQGRQGRPEGDHP